MVIRVFVAIASCQFKLFQILRVVVVTAYFLLIVILHLGLEVLRSNLYLNLTQVLPRTDIGRLYFY
jgi:hypothetical protein